MAVFTNTFQSNSAAANREQLMGVVHRVAPEDTPIYSSIPKGKAKGTKEEWITDTLATPAENAQLDGDEFAYLATASPGRPNNRTQIFRKGFIISGTQQAVENAGNVEKLRYQTLRRGIELRKDTEYNIIGFQKSVGGNTRKSGGLSSWLETNVSRGASGADGGYASGTGLTSVATNGTQRAMTKALMDSVMQDIYESGAMPKMVSLSPYAKSVFVSFISTAGTAEFRTAVSAGGRNTIVATADMYEGPFGTVRIMPNRVQASGPTGNRAAAGADATNTKRQNASNAWFFDPSYVTWLWLRPIHRVPRIATTGDATKRMLLGEGTLCVKNEKAHGAIADIFGNTSST